MSIFQRLFKVGQSEAHAIVEKLEDPIKMTEQGIRDLRENLASAMQSLTEVKGVAIRLRKDATDKQNQVGEYERKAMLLLQRGASGELDQTSADRLANEALTKQGAMTETAASLAKQAETQERASAMLQQKIEQFKSAISTYENELLTLRSRAQTAASTKKINQQLAQVDSSSTIAMLERMKQKVEEDEALSQAYGEVADIATGATSIDAEINRTLAVPAGGNGSDALASLKAKMGLPTLAQQ